MFSEMRSAWRKLRRQADWRQLNDGSRPEFEYAGVVIGQSGASGGTNPGSQVYDIFVRGKLVATRHTLASAKEAADQLLTAEGVWKRRTMNPVQVTHYFFGDTTEFAPTYFWTRDE